MAEPSIIYQTNKKSGVTYAYENQPYWDPVKKQSRATRKLLGKVDPLTGDIVPTRGRKRAEDQEPENQAAMDNQLPEDWIPDSQPPEKQASLFDIVQIINKVLIFFRLFMCETLAKRVISIVLIAIGLPDSRVAELTGLCDKTVSILKKRLENGEIDSMFHVAGGGRKRKLADVEVSIVDEINNGAYHSHQQIADMIQERYGIKVSLPAIGRLLKKTESGG